MTKFVFVTGGVVSGLGKGITAASIGRLLKARGLTVDILKFGPYLNVDSSNLDPCRHGEVFVTDDGAEGDRVLGHYERILGENVSGDNEITTGRIYSDIIERERRGEYDGSTIQIVPHVTDEIKEHIFAFDGKADVVIVDVGGTVGDIECHPFLEAIRQCRNVFGRNNAVYVHVTLVPYIGVSGEQKTKPTQHSVKELQNIGIQPDVIVCRTDRPLAPGSKDKLALFCNVDKDCIIENLTTENVFDIPLLLESEGLARAVCRKLALDLPEPDLADMREFCDKLHAVNESGAGVKVAIVGVYTDKKDAYLSLGMALVHSGTKAGVRVTAEFVQAENIDCELLADCDGVIIAGGYGSSGFEGKILAAKYTREHDIPSLMIGMGAQAGAIEFARDVLGLAKANSAEFDKKTPAAIVVRSAMGVGRKGAFLTRLKPGSRLYAIYGAAEIKERHRHKYEFNKAFRDKFAAAGLNFTGESKDGKLPEAFELAGSRFHVGVIFHPEFISRPSAPHPLITAFVSECAAKH